MTTFTITFHGPFHVGSGVPGQGLARLLDRGALLPATSLKGLMRAAARETLGLPHSLLAEVFGGAGSQNVPTRREPSPWAWSDAEFGECSFQNLARIKISDRTRTVERGFVMMGESVWADSATFTVTQHREILGDLAGHLLVLRASARAVTGLGGGRRRGEGWVAVTDPEPWAVADTQALRRLGGR